MPLSSEPLAGGRDVIRRRIDGLLAARLKTRTPTPGMAYSGRVLIAIRLIAIARRARYDPGHVSLVRFQTPRFWEPS